MRKLAEILSDSYPVGLDVSQDGKWLITTSQGRKNQGGNCVDIYNPEGVQSLEIPIQYTQEAEAYSTENIITDKKESKYGLSELLYLRNWICILFGGLIYMMYTFLS